jgi:adenylate cyclase class 2
VYEVEVKFEAAHDPVRSRLEALGAEALGVVQQRDTYYDHPVRSFVETDEALRLRRESTPEDGAVTAKLTYKGPLVDVTSKTREEIETGVAAVDATDALLRAVGFVPAASVEKERERFSIEGYRVALDRVAGLGEFVEVEAAGERDDVATLRDGAYDLCRRLGLHPDESIRTSYLALVVDAST